MPKKPSMIDASTLLATKEKAPLAISGSLQRGQTATETLVDLNFKVPPDFRQRFKRLAFDAQLKNVHNKWADARRQFEEGIKTASSVADTVRAGLEQAFDDLRKALLESKSKLASSGR